MWGAGGRYLGRVVGTYFHNITHRATWIQVSDGAGSALVPLDHVGVDSRGIRVPYRFEQLVTAPRPHPGSAGLDATIEQALYTHYHGAAPGVAAPVPADPPEVAADEPGPTPAAGAGDGVVVRSEERLRIDHHIRPYRRVRLVTSIVTENVTFTVPVSHQEVRLEEVPLADTADGGAGVWTAGQLSADVHEVVLHREEVSFTTRVVPVERVRLVRRIVSGEQLVHADRSAEQIDLVHDPRDATGDPSPARHHPPDPLETRHEPT